MNNGIMLTQTCVLAALLMAGCGPSGENSADTGNSNTSETQGITKIKGMYIGMPVSEVPELLRKSLTDTDITISDVLEPGTGYYDFQKTPYVLVSFRGEKPPPDNGRLLAVTDTDRNVIEFRFDTMLVNELFSAKDMNHRDFFTKFAEAYNIPEWTINDDLDGVYYTSPEGWKITIYDLGGYDNKSIRIKKVAGEQEVKQSFN